MRLRYYTDENPGFTRRRSGRGFSYLDIDGAVISDPGEKARLAALAVPPAYEDVWLSPFANGHLLATGRDEKGRKQYIYHERWRAARDAEKFADLAEVGATLPKLRRWIAERLKGPLDDRETAIATALALIERGSLRPGSPAYTRENASYGATTLLPEHFQREGSVSVLTYKAKGGQIVEKRVRGERLAEVLEARRHSGSKQLIQYQSEQGDFCPVLPRDLNERVAQLCGPTASVKDLRTWNGTLTAFRAAQCECRLTKKAMAEAAAATLHNTAAIAQASYIHPAVLDLSEFSAENRKARLAQCKSGARRGFRLGEQELLAFLGTH
ncbi:MAG: DNA topoisomerase IB [Paracoccaceae bacterium]